MGKHVFLVKNHYILNEVLLRHKLREILSWTFRLEEVVAFDSERKQIGYKIRACNSIFSFCATRLSSAYHSFLLFFSLLK